MKAWIIDFQKMYAFIMSNSVRRPSLYLLFMYFRFFKPTAVTLSSETLTFGANIYICKYFLFLFCLAFSGMWKEFWNVIFEILHIIPTYIIPTMYHVTFSIKLHVTKYKRLHLVFPGEFQILFSLEQWFLKPFSLHAVWVIRNTLIRNKSATSWNFG